MKDRNLDRDLTSDPTLENEWVVGVGASAGGLEALTQLISNLPKAFQAPIIVAQHLAPHAKSMMVELLQRHTERPIVAATHKQKLEPATIYIVPPNYDIDIVDHHILLTLAGSETRPKPSIDEFFISLANACGKHAIGVVLSGTGSDGSDGIKAIKAAGGYTLAQDDHSAKYDGMPRSAVNTGDVDSILPPDVIAKSLPQILIDHESKLRLKKLDRKSLDKILALVKQVQGTDFAQYKSSTITRRVAKHMSALGIKSINEFYDFLQESPAEVSKLAQEMLVSVTSFFRDPEIFQSLSPQLNRIIDYKKNGDEVRVWVAGCATGEEAYTLAMLFQEEIDVQNKHLILKVFATDLDQDALVEARNGFYAASDCSRIPKDLLGKYFQSRGDGYEISKRLREIVVFAKQDLTQNPPFVKLDFISCRNVLIYFDPVLQKKVIEIFHYALNPSGILLLGKSESVSILTNLFDTVDRVRKVFQKLNVPSKVLPTARTSSVVSTSGHTRARTSMVPTVAELSYLRLLKSYGICGVTVDENCNIIHIIGDVSPYLGFFVPQPDFRLTSLLPKGVGVEIPILIRKAAKDGKIHRSRGYSLPKLQKNDIFYICVRPLGEESREEVESERLFIVNFELKKKPKSQVQTTLNESELPTRVAELEQELFVTREHLQTVVEELGVSNEELQSLNEELSSTNEELQASSEELETTNEELQSSNEELTTVNEELNVKQTELRALNNSFENVQNSLGSPMVILDEKRRIVRFSPEAMKLFTLSYGDLGREITRVASNFEIPDFDERLREAIQRAKKTETLISVGNTLYQLRIMPCFDERKQITGAILIFIDNTDLLRTQEKLAASDIRFKAIINGSSSIIFLKDTLGRYLLVNEAFKAFFGLDEKQIIGRTDREIFDENMAVPLREADLEVLVKRSLTRREEVFTKPDGKNHWFLSSRFPLMDQAGETPYAIGTVAVDITTRVQTQEELFRSESRYRAIVEDQSVFVCRHDPQGQLTFVNSAFARQFGGSPEMNFGQLFSRIVPENERQRVKSEIETININNPIVQYEHRTLDMHGQERWVKWIHRGIFDTQSRVIEYQAVGFDITDVKQRTDQLVQRDMIFTSLFDQTIDFITVIRVHDDKFMLESFNRSAGKAFGSASMHIVGSNLKDILDPAFADVVLDRYRQCATTGRPQVYEESIELPGGVRFLSTTLVPIPGPSGRIERIASVSRDISSYKRAEIDLRKAKDEADQANRSKSDFLATMSHELRTPLNVVLGMSQLLSDTTLTSEQKNYLSSIRRSGDVLLNLIEDVLDVSKIESGAIQLEAIAFCPTDVVADVVDLFKIQAKEKGITISQDVSGEADRLVIGDPARLRQILVNLVSNAMKFTDRGSVQVQVRSHLDKLSNDNVLHFKVKDTGIGIAEADHARLFQRFSQIDSSHSRKYGGTGLGLMISKQLVNMMSGSIGFESARGEGSTFWFTIHLPLSKHSKQTNRKTEALNAPVRHAEPDRILRILAVDDNPDSRALIGLFLKKLGHVPIVAGDGKDALQKLQQNEVDIVLMDIQMPEMDGYEATAHIRKLQNPKSKIPIVALTANAMAGDSDRAFRAGMDDYLTKPLEINSLKLFLNKWISRIQQNQEKA